MSPCTYVNKGPRAGPDASTLTRIRQRDVPDDRCYECCRRVRLRLLPPQTPTTTTPNDLQAPGQGHSAEIGPVLDMGASMDRLSLTHLWPPPPRHATPPRPSRRDAAACLSTLAGSVPKPPPLAHRASAAVGQWPRWSKTWVTFCSGPWHTSQQLLGRFFVLSPSGEVTFDYVKTPPPAIVCSGRTLGEK